MSTLSSKKSTDSAAEILQLRDQVRILKERISNLEAVEGKVENLEAIVEELQLQVKKKTTVYVGLPTPRVLSMLAPSCFMGQVVNKHLAAFSNQSTWVR